MDEVAALLGDDQAGLSQDAEVLGDNGLGGTEVADEGIDAEDSAGEELDDAHAQRGGEGLEEAGRELDVWGGRLH